ncbi:hypothetical protein RN001_010947 [Aquatica leii]|uniref:Uncharacterized protein n=1 Tax=Aquatica leii TaxID=1421715 RepID=A0AAN7PAF5_9COLE|nr:hypothetical protein RN001_010947 [Aquatica leii]
MSGYKRVNFYELCRLCATNQQKEKTHIFQEEGRKIQLQNKIQSCLSLKVCENDFLPKVVCSQCLRTLEECCIFRKECYSSETMLSSYFNNFRYTDDFKKSGKVYIKDTSPKASALQSTTETPYVNVLPTPTTNVNQETLPYYTLQLPTAPQPQEPKPVKESKMIPQPQIIYNLNTIKTVVPKNLDPVNNITVNSNGEIITIGSLVDMDTLVPIVQKSIRKSQKKIKDDDRLKMQKKDLIPPSFNSVSTPVRTNPLNVNRAQKFLNFNNVGMNTNVCATNNINTVHISNMNGSGDIAEAPVMSVPVGYNVAQYPKQDVHVDGLSSDLYSSGSQGCSVLRSGAQFSGQSFTTFSSMGSNSGNHVESLPKQEIIKRHTCDICGKTFKRREHLYQHMKLHTGFRPFTCENCNKSFLRKEHLLRHMVAHSGQKNFTCTICDKSFSRNDNLLKHKKIHNKQNSFTCEVCQKQFVMEHYYFAHKRTHDNEKCVNQAWGLLKAI